MQLLEEEDSADDEFWNQDFFQEEKADVDYQSESSEATTADEDFSESVGIALDLLIRSLVPNKAAHPWSIILADGRQSLISACSCATDALHICFPSR